MRVKERKKGMTDSIVEEGRKERSIMVGSETKDNWDREIKERDKRRVRKKNTGNGEREKKSILSITKALIMLPLKSLTKLPLTSGTLSWAL